MDKHEYRAKTEQMLQYMSQKSYKQAGDIADGIDWRRVKNASMLCAVSEIYEYNGEYEKSRDVLFLAFERAPESRKIVYRLGTLALKMKDIQEATDCYEEFVKLAPNDSNQYILQYKILKCKNAPLEEQIEALNTFKSKEYVEKWAYELALLYHKAGNTEKCLEECDDIILWFDDEKNGVKNAGKYVYKAMELKKRYKALTPLQQEKYDLIKKTDDIVLKKDVESEVTVKEEEEKEPEVTVKEETKESEVILKEEIKEEEIKEEEIKEPEVIVKEEEEKEPEVTVKEEEVKEPEKQQAPMLSIEEMLQEWEAKQKENAQLIQEEYKKAEQKKAEENNSDHVENIEGQNSVSNETILPDDIRKLMEELESEAADIATQKAKQDISAEPAKKSSFGNMIGAVLEPVMEVVRSVSDAGNEDEFEMFAEESEEPAVTEKVLGAEEAQEAAVSQKELAVKADDEFVVETDPKESFIKENLIKETVIMETDNQQEGLLKESLIEVGGIPNDELEKTVSHSYDASMLSSAAAQSVVIEEDPGIKLGDTQSMAAVAKALKNVALAEASVKTEEENTKEYVPEKQKSQNLYDTGFIVQGRYDLEAQSEVGLKAGLTEEQKKLFSYFVPVHGMSEQLVEVLQKDKKCKDRYGTSRIGNLLIIGRKGSGKTVLAVDIVKAIQKARKLKQGKVGIVTADSLNKKDVTEILSKLHGGAIIIEKASHLSRRSIEDMCDVMEGQTGELLVVLEDERKPLERMLEQYPQFRKKFTSRLELPVFINDELVTFGQTYAKENGYKIDEMGILALYSRIDMLQRDEHIVTVSDVKEIMDAAIDNSQRASFKKVMKKLFGKNKDDSERILLREEDFK